jgi:16S rRNA processing protein RimM
VSDERSTLEVGRILRAHGLKGQVVVDLWTDQLQRLAPGTILETERGPLTVKSSIHHQNNRHLVSFEGIADRNDSERWRGVVLSAERIEDDSVIWIDQLFGATVYDQNDEVRGVVVDVEANPASDLLVLENGFLIPLVFVTEVEANAVVRVAVPEGLFE